MSAAIMKTLIASIFLACSASAFACATVTALPFAITTPGKYCLANNVQSSNASGIQISIGASDVTLDMAGFALKCTAGQNAIMTTATLSNVVVQNGAVRDCNYAVLLNNCTGCTVSNIRAINNSVGISVAGHAARIEHNLVRNDQLGAGNPAILVEAHSALIQGNQISGANIGVMNRGKGNVIRSNSFGLCGTAIRFDVRASFQDNLTQQCASAFAGAELASSVNAGGNF